MGEVNVLSRIDPDLVIQESMYGIIMALTLILTAKWGLFHYDSNAHLVLAIIGMDFVWSTIDMLIFYRLDILARYRRVHAGRLLHKLESGEEKRTILNAELEDTVFDFLDNCDRARLMDLLADSKFVETMDIHAHNKHYLLNAFAAFVVNLMGVIPSVICLLLIPDYSDALLASALLSSVALFFVGYCLAPSRVFKARLCLGISTAGMAIAFTVFAAMFGG